MPFQDALTSDAFLGHTLKPGWLSYQGVQGHLHCLPSSRVCSWRRCCVLLPTEPLGQPLADDTDLKGRGGGAWFRPPMATRNSQVESEVTWLPSGLQLYSLYGQDEGEAV